MNNFRLWFSNHKGDTSCRELNSLYEAKKKMPEFMEECLEYSQNGASFSIHDVGYDLVIQPVFNSQKEIVRWEVKN